MTDRRTRSGVSVFELATDIDKQAERLTMVAAFARLRDHRDRMTPLQRMATDLSEIRAANYGAGRATRLVCPVHDEDLEDCKRAPWGQRCQGIPLVSPSDPTGEAIVADSVGRISLRVLRNAVDVIDLAITEALAEIDRWQLLTHEQAQTIAEGQDEAANAVDGPWCECCLRAGKHAPPEGKSARTCDGRLEQAMWLCAWCQKWVRGTGSLPSLMVSEAHCSGAKVRWFKRGDVIEAKTMSGTLVDRMPAPKRASSEDVA